MIRAARLTAPLPGALAVVALEGEGLASLLAPFLDRPLPPPGRTRVVVLRAGGAILDRALLAVAANGRVEVSLHGGPAVVEAFIAALEERGAQVLAGAQLSFAGALERAAWERSISVLALPAVAVLMAQSGGALRRALGQLLDLFARGEGRAARCELAQLCRAGRAALPFFSPLQILILGPANAGKSTYFNALVGRERARVARSAGTTVDPISEILALDAFTLELRDSAAIGGASGKLARRAEERSWSALAGADLVLWLSPAGREPPPEGLCSARAPILRVATMADLEGRPASGVDLSVSALRRPAACRASLSAALQRIWPIPDALSHGGALPFDERILAQLEGVLDAAGDDRARASLEELVF